MSACALALALSSCAAAPPKRPLAAGYYSLNESRFGVWRRIVITAGDRRASYDVWRVSDTGDGTVRHGHYDLIAQDEVPSSGAFAITQDGTDCGTLSIEPYRHRGSVYDGVLVVRYGVLGIEHFHSLAGDDATTYRFYDDDVTHQMEQVAADRPQLYNGLSLLGRFFYSELNPHCTYD